MDLTPERALIFRITHVSNVPWILDYGLRCASLNILDPGFRPIGSAGSIEKRAPRSVPAAPGGALSDYIAFFFTPH
jgi:ssDNA thymidine ADP-ribosyltransferase, DarT